MRAMVERPVDALDEAEPDCMIVYVDGLTIRLRQPLPSLQHGLPIERRQHTLF